MNRKEHLRCGGRGKGGAKGTIHLPSYCCVRRKKLQRRVRGLEPRVLHSYCHSKNASQSFSQCEPHSSHWLFTESSLFLSIKLHLQGAKLHLTFSSWVLPPHKLCPSCCRACTISLWNNLPIPIEVLMQTEINLICIETSDTLTSRVKALNCDSEDMNLIPGSSTGVILQEWFHKRIMLSHRTAGDIKDMQEAGRAHSEFLPTFVMWSEPTLAGFICNWFFAEEQELHVQFKHTFILLIKASHGGKKGINARIFQRKVLEFSTWQTER